MTENRSRRSVTGTVKADSTWELRMKIDHENVPSRVRVTCNRKTVEASVPQPEDESDEDD